MIYFRVKSSEDTKKQCHSLKKKKVSPTKGFFSDATEELPLEITKDIFKSLIESLKVLYVLKRFFTLI